MKNIDTNDEIKLAADISKNGYTLSFHYDSLVDLFYVGIVKNKKKHKDTYAQIVLKKEDIIEIIEWLLKASKDTLKVNKICCLCTSLCEALVFIKMDGGIYVQLYHQASFRRLKIGNTRDNFYLTENEAGVIGRALSVFLKTEVKANTENKN